MNSEVQKKKKRVSKHQTRTGIWEGWETFRPLRGFFSLRSQTAIADWRSPLEGETSLNLPIFPSLSDVLSTAKNTSTQLQKSERKRKLVFWKVKVYGVCEWTFRRTRDSTERMARKWKAQQMVEERTLDDQQYGSEEQQESKGFGDRTECGWMRGFCFHLPFLVFPNKASVIYVIIIVSLASGIFVWSVTHWHKSQW